ncbi:MAG: hypothetical protein LC715_02605 [Gammaproteobacteria bacterium]|nr:hypothetical protein [Gammaproteobacteria bacterium]
MLIYEQSQPGRSAVAQHPADRSTAAAASIQDIPAALLRDTPVGLPEVSELQVVRHYTNLSRRNFSIDTQFYPLGSCTMKYNPRACHSLALLDGFASVREIPTKGDGDIDIEALKLVLGPNTAGIMLTNPSTIGVFERRIVEIAKLVHAAGGLLYYDGANLNAILGKVRPGDMGFDAIHMNLHKTFSTPHGGGGPGAGAVGVSERLRDFLPIPMIEKIVLPSPAGRGGGGEGSEHAGTARGTEPSSAPAGHLAPRPGLRDDAKAFSAARADGSQAQSLTPEGEGKIWYRFIRKKDRPLSIGRLSAFAGNAGVLLRAYVYARMLGREGMVRVAEYATLNANYLAAQLRKAGFTLAYPERRASHEFIVTVQPQKKANGITALDFSKALLDHNIHAPTNYFPLLVPECLLIEPTETESKQTLDEFIAVMTQLLAEARDNPERMKGAPYTMPVRRLDDVKAVRELDVAFKPAAAAQPAAA